jgi:hypothetical protein
VTPLGQNAVEHKITCVLRRRWLFRSRIIVPTVT